MIFFTHLNTTHTEQISAKSQASWLLLNSGYPDIEPIDVIISAGEYSPIERGTSPIKDGERRENNTQKGEGVENESNCSKDRGQCRK